MRLIDADELSKRIHDLNNWCKDFRKPGLEQACYIIDDFPGIGTVRHGKWTPIEDEKYSVYCSVCGDIGNHRYDYCPKCGAKMDSEP